MSNAEMMSCKRTNLYEEKIMLHQNESACFLFLGLKIQKGNHFRPSLPFATSFNLSYYYHIAI